MRPVDVKVGQFVRPKTSKMKGQVGCVVGFHKNNALPIAVVFEGTDEWDFKVEELELVIRDEDRQRSEDNKVEQSTSDSISYDDAVKQLAYAVDVIKDVNLFHMSSILAVLFDEDKHKTMDDLLEHRGVRK